MMRQKIILVDEFDREIGSAEKLKVHKEGLLHRAFSVFVVNDKDDLLLQKRNNSKYHSPGLWTNTCCSHPAPGEDLQLIAEKRLFEEMGFSCSLTWLFKFMYKTTFENNSKYHSPGLWTNTCCSHPSPGEDLQLIAEKRLFEEMGFTCSLTWLFKFMYKTTFENKLTEYEIDHVFLGRSNIDPVPNPDEVADWRWVNLDFLKADLKNNSHQYTFWFCHIYDRFFESYVARQK